MTFQSRSLAQFALLSELVWLSVYCSVSITASFFDSVPLASTPFIILVLTAVEAVIVWSLVVQAAHISKV